MPVSCVKNTHNFSGRERNGAIESKGGLVKLSLSIFIFSAGWICCCAKPCLIILTPRIQLTFPV